MLVDVARPPVPAVLRGAWRRTWIRHADGSVDDTSTVLWLQLESARADIRVATDLRELADRGSLSECSVADLRLLARSESSTGRTECTPVVATGDGRRHATAEWFVDIGAVEFQPVTAYPEPGLLKWNDDATEMTERAPSGAYVEEWHRMPGSDGPLSHEVRPGAVQVFRAGSTAILVRDRPRRISRRERLEVLVADAGDDREALEPLVDCEFSLATVLGGVATITASTLPWRAGEGFDVAR